MVNRTSHTYAHGTIGPQN